MITFLLVWIWINEGDVRKRNAGLKTSLYLYLCLNTLIAPMVIGEVGQRQRLQCDIPGAFFLDIKMKLLSSSLHLD